MAVVTRQAAAALERCLAGGGVALFGADTVYGLACDPDNHAAVHRLYEIKGRPPAKPAAMMAFTIDPLAALLAAAGPRTEAACRLLLPGAVTLLIANPGHRFAGACGEDPGTIGVRVPALPRAIAALAGIRAPFMQTSANLAGGPESRTLGGVSPEVAAAADFVLDAGELPGTASTVVDLRAFEKSGLWEIVRHGAVPLSQISAALS